MENACVKRKIGLNRKTEILWLERSKSWRGRERALRCVEITQVSQTYTRRSVAPNSRVHHLKERASKGEGKSSLMIPVRECMEDQSVIPLFPPLRKESDAFFFLARTRIP
jgi:hypothetical protein